MYPAVLLMYIISAAVILPASPALIVHVSLIGRASVLYSFILVFLRVFYGLNTLFKIPEAGQSLRYTLQIFVASGKVRHICHCANHKGIRLVEIKIHSFLTMALYGR